MTIITKGMGAIIKGLTSRGTPYKRAKLDAIRGEGKRRKKLLDKGYVEIQRTNPKHGTKYTDYVQSTDFDYRMKPGFPGNKKQGVLFTQKFNKPKTKKQLTLPGLGRLSGAKKK